MTDWTATEGTSFPLGATWVESASAWNFALYSEDAESVTLLLYAEADLVNPVFTYRFDYLRNKSGRIWHCRVARALLRGARYYAYSVAGPEPRCAHGTALTRTRSFSIPTRSRSSFPRPSTGQRLRVPVPMPARHRWACSPGAGERSTGATTDDPGISRTPSFTSCTFGGSRTTRTQACSPERRGTYSGVVEKIPVPERPGRHRGGTHARLPVRPAGRELLGLHAAELFRPPPRLRQPAGRVRASTTNSAPWSRRSTPRTSRSSSTWSTTTRRKATRAGRSTATRESTTAPTT